MSCRNYWTETGEIVRSYCSITGDAGIPEYCSTNGQFCPRTGGDDRYRRTDALTEEVALALVRGVRFSIDQASAALRDGLSDIGAAIARTGYAALANAFWEAGMRPVERMHLAVGAYQGIVPSDMERNLAVQLEEHIDLELAAFRPADLMPGGYLGAEMLQISSGGFRLLLDRLENTADTVSAVLESSGTFSGNAKLDAPARSALRNLADGTAGWLREIGDSLQRVWDLFEVGVRTGAQGGETYGYAGGLPQWF